MDYEKDIMIESLRKQLQDALKKISAMEQEIAFQNNEIARLKRLLKMARKEHGL